VSGAVEFALHREIVGEGSPTLVFLHYWGGSARTWRPRRAAPRGEPSLRRLRQSRMGRSGGTESGFAIADLARDALSVVGGLAPADVVLVGHSMGGKVAQAVAASRPAELRGLVLVAPAPGPAPAATAAWPLAAITEDVSRGVREIDVPTLVVGADHDVVEPVELLREHVVAVIPGARLVEIPDCRHLIPIEQPERLANEIASFIERET
jgi:pimeloyl-ACP methyl ester carboxylesterase